jgi:hypothetical protein
VSAFSLEIPPITSKDSLTVSRNYQKKGLISNDDMLYTLSVFALEPVRWVKRYEWREMTPMEICAL